MRAHLHSLQQPRSSCIGIGGFVQQCGADALEQGLQLSRRPNHDQQQFRRDRFQQRGPALRRKSIGQACERLPYECEETPADDERQDGRIKECFDDLALAAWHLLDAVVALQLLEEQLDLSAERVRRADVLRRELLDRNVRDVEVMALRVLVSNPHHA